MITNFYQMWVYPLTGGGPLRVYYLNKIISRKYPILQISLRPTYAMKNIYSLRNLINRRKLVRLCPNYMEYQISTPITIFLSVVCYKLLSNPDIFWKPSLINIKDKIILNTIYNSNVFQIESPTLYEIASKYNKRGVPIFLSAHNCETKIQTNEFAKKIMRNIEAYALENADAIFAVSEEDIIAFRKILNVDIDGRKIYLLPNGVDTQKIKPAEIEEKDYAKSLLGLENRNVIIFIGSYYKPNAEAVWEIIKIAKHFDNSYVFLIVGSVDKFFKKISVPPNVIFTGFVSDISVYLKAADLALNPILFGSGTNLKMLEYLAAGLPTISTPIGARGLKIKNGRHAIIADVSEFEYWIKEILNSQSLYSRLSRFGRKIVEDYYDWHKIANIAIKAYKKYLL